MCGLHAAERYEVECSTYLNVRAEKSTSSDILGVLDNGETITVHSIDGDWAEIGFRLEICREGRLTQIAVAVSPCQRL